MEENVNDLHKVIADQSVEILKWKESAEYNWEQYQDLGKLHFDLIEKIRDILHTHYIDGNIDCEQALIKIDTLVSQILAEADTLKESEVK